MDVLAEGWEVENKLIFRKEKTFCPCIDEKRLTVEKN